MTKILVVDDEKDVRDFTVGFFRDRNFETSSAINGNEAFQIIKRDRPHIILLEMGLKDTDGIEVLKYIRKIDRNAKVIVVTHVNDMEIIDEAIRLGAIAYLTKPILLSELMDIVLKNLRKRRIFFKLKNSHRR